VDLHLHVVLLLHLLVVVHLLLHLLLLRIANGHAPLGVAPGAIPVHISSHVLL
jgi:hypothetical protein